MSPRLPIRPLALALLLLTTCSAERRPDVAIVVNERSPVSTAIGEYYAASRRVPARRIIRLSIPVADPMLRDAAHETIDRPGFDRLVRRPMERWLREHDPAGRIEVLVTTKGIPLRVAGPDVPPEALLRDATSASVDAELSLLFSDLVGSAGVAGSRNPYYDDPRDFATFRREEPDSPLRYMVARLTGYAGGRKGSPLPEDVRRLIDAGQAEGAEPGLWLVDLDPSLPRDRDAANRVLLAPAAAALEALGVRLVEDERPDFVGDMGPLQAYASWGSNDGHEASPRTYGWIDGHEYPGRFASRAVAVDLVSTNARTFTRPAHYGQSLVADLVRAGVAGAAGHVDEPTLPAVARPRILMGDYAGGSLAIEAYYRALPYLGWMNVYVGDPLARLEGGGDRPTPIDRDSDGILDHRDNCLDIPNPRQRDTDADGLGNFCDADVDGDGLVTTSWGQSYPRGARGDVEWIALTARDGRYDPDHDLDGDQRVDERDVSIAQIGLFMPPGPGPATPD